MQAQKRQCIFYNLGLVPYSVAWKMQRDLVARRIEDFNLKDVLILLEHPAVYTLGTGASLDFIKFDLDRSDYEVYRIERGGEVTYHCPGQLVAYPIINLRYYQQDLHWYLRQLEEVIIRLLRIYDLEGYRSPGFTGVWLEGFKVAAIGIKVRRWITMHGFSLNVCPDLAGFDRIVPCGIEDKPVGSIKQFRKDVDITTLRHLLCRTFAEVFEVEIEENLDFN
ncbi:MAG: lipoyl(octanoyl) transferase LipB [Prochloraceae cyanobacterium]